MLFDEGASVVETNADAHLLPDNVREHCSHVSASDHKSPLPTDEQNISLKRSPRCRQPQSLPQQTENDTLECNNGPVQPNPQAVITPSLGTNTVSNYSTTTANDCFLRDPESLLLSIINMATSSPPLTSTQKPIPAIQSTLDSCQMLERQVLESLPHLSSLQVSPIPDRKERSIRPTTATDPQCNAGMLFTRKKYKFSNTIAEFSRCLSAKTVTKHPDSVFDSELESSCVTPRFLHAVPLRESPIDRSQDEGSKSNKQTTLECSLRLQCLTHTESSAISTVDSLNASSSCTIVTPTAPLSARLPPLSALNTAKQQAGELEGPGQPSHAAPLDCIDVKPDTEKRQAQLTGPIPLLALPRSSISTKDNMGTSRSPNRPNANVINLDSKEPDSKYDSGSCSRRKRDSDGSAGTSARRFQSLEKYHNITHLKLPTNINEPGKSSVRSTTDNIHLDLALPECSSARFDPSTRQLEQSVQHFEPEQLCILNTHIALPEPTLESAAFQPLIAVAACNNINEASILSSLRLTDITANPKSDAGPEETCSEEDTIKRRCKSTPSSRSQIRPVPCRDPIFDAASFKILSESGDDVVKLDTVEHHSLRRVHTSLLTYDSSAGYGSCALSRSLNLNIPATQERPRKYLITSGRISITPARKSLRVSLIQLDQLFDESQAVGKAEDSKRCRSSESIRISNSDTSNSRPSSMHEARLHPNNHSSITLTPIVASSRGQSRSSGRKNSRVAGSRGTSCYSMGSILHQRKSVSTPGPRLQLEPMVQNEQSVSLTTKHSTNQEASSAVRSRQQRLQTGNRYRPSDGCREDIRQAMARMCLSNTDTDKYRTLSVRQRLRGLQPLVRGSKVISDD